MLPEQQTMVEASLDEAPTVVIQPSRGLAFVDLRALWQYRELLYFLVWRDVKVRYKQTALGVLWVVLQPLASMGVFTLLFGVLLNAPSGEEPYPVFALAGLLPWSYFATALTRASNSVVNSAHLVSKIYFPRLVIPLSAALAGLVDLAVGMLVFVVLMVVYHIAPTVALLLLPVLLLLAMATALGFGLWLSALNVRYRDVGYLAPFVVQLWMYLTPVVYASTLIPERWRFLLSLNPMTAVVEGFRRALLGPGVSDVSLSPGLVAISVAVALAVLVSGLVFFRTTERSFADVV
ncbi:MAG: ABC transporter permease [Anaerolineae bacterium]|jgi:lipopolysaccharide transport system permease protein